MNNIAISLRSVSKRFGDVEAVRKLDLDIKKGSIVGILGPNGAGKTTTIKLISGLLKPSSGNITVAGYDINLEPERAKQAFALVPDVPYVYEKLTAWEFMSFIARIYKLKVENLNSEIERHLKIFNMATVAHELIDSYSHGMRQRLLMASVMLRDPDIIILDEPMVGLDPEAARLVKDLFKKLSKANRTIFLSTHTLVDAEELCDDIAIIDKGKLVARGNMDELKEQTQKFSNLEDIYLKIIKDG